MRGQLPYRLRATHAFGDMAELGDDAFQRLAGRQSQPDLPVARQVTGACQYQVAHAGQSHEGFRAAAQRDAQP